MLQKLLFFQRAFKLNLIILYIDNDKIAVSNFVAVAILCLHLSSNKLDEFCKNMDLGEICLAVENKMFAQNQWEKFFNTISLTFTQEEIDSKMILKCVYEITQFLNISIKGYIPVILNQNEEQKQENQKLSIKNENLNYIIENITKLSINKNKYIII